MEIHCRALPTAVLTLKNIAFGLMTETALCWFSALR